MGMGQDDQMPILGNSFCCSWDNKDGGSEEAEGLQLVGEEVLGWGRPEGEKIQVGSAEELCRECCHMACSHFSPAASLGLQALQAVKEGPDD